MLAKPCPRYATIVLLFLIGCSADEPSDAQPAATGSGSSSSSSGVAGDDGSASAAGGAGTADGSGGVGGDASAPAGSGGGGSTGSGTGGSGNSLSAGCGVPAAPSGATQHTIEVSGVQRDYQLVVPSGYDPNTPLSLVFAWHGLGGSGALARLYFGVEQQSAGQAVFVYADGIAAPFSNGLPGWDLGENGDVLLFDAILDEVTASHCIDESRIFSTGHSFGGYMSNALGCWRPNVVRAIAPVASGGPPFTCTSTQPVAAWITHGSADAIVAPSKGIEARDHWLAANQCDTTTSAVSPSPCAAYDGCIGGAPLHWCEHGGDHDWPSFAAEGIWGFFASLP
jgi:poly(3-hydroxybutyrate) depolymerase